MILNNTPTDKNKFSSLITKRYTNRLILEFGSTTYLFMIYKSIYGNHWIVNFFDPTIQKTCLIGVFELYDTILKVVSKNTSAKLRID